MKTKIRFTPINFILNAIYVQDNSVIIHLKEMIHFEFSLHNV